MTGGKEGELYDKFLSLVSHDLRSPIGGMKVALQSLEEDPTLGVENRKFVGQIADNCQRILDLLDTLVSISRLKSGKIAPDKAYCDLHHIVAGQMAKFGGMADEKKIAVNNGIRAGSKIFCDEALFGECLGNLLSNSVKFTGKGGKVSVAELSKEDGGKIGETTLVVKDNGVGIDPAIVPSIFNLEKKTVYTGTSGEQGVGLGLPFCREAVEAHGGRIWIESVPGKGTEVYLSLPLPGALVMVVDDQDVAREMARDCLLDTGVEMIGAEDAVSASALLEKNFPSLIIVDINLPGTDGFGLIRALKDRPGLRETAIVAATSDELKRVDGMDPRAYSEKLGCAGFVLKPYLKMDLEPLVRRFVLKE